MRNDPAHEGRRWLEQAQADLGWARRLHADGGYYLVCFLAQQAAEKALKAFLYAQGEEVVLGHSVRQLSVRAVEFDGSLARWLDSWAILDAHYIPTRYPNGLPDDIPARVYGADVSSGALQRATEVLEEVARRMRP